MKRIILFISFSLTYTLAFAQDNYRTIADGAWNGANTWEKDTGGNSVYAATATTPTSSNSISITILNGHEVNVSAAVTIDQTTVASGGQITIDASQTLTINNGTGDDLTVNSGGILMITGSITIGSNRIVRIYGNLNNIGNINNGSNSSRLIFEAGSTYEHQYTTTNGAIPIASWNNGSTCLINGYTENTNAPSNLNQSFYNFTWDCELQESASEIDLQGNPASVVNNFTISSTGDGIVYFDYNDTGGNLSIGGNFVQSGGIFYYKFEEATADETMTVTGNFSISNGSFILTSFDISTAPVILSIEGNLNITGGIFDINQSTATATVNLQGNYSHTGGTLTKGSIGTATINFVPPASPATQTFTSSIALSSAIRYAVTSTAILDIASTSFISGSGTFALAAGSTLIIRSDNGIVTGTGSGNIRVSGTRTYTAGATIIYNGSASQALGNGFPSNVNLTINNSSGVSLSGNTTISTNRTLALTSGSLTIGSNTLTLNGTTSVGTGSLTATNTSNLTIGGTGTLGTIPFSGGTTQIGNFTLNRTSSGAATLGSNIDITGVLDLEAGDFIINSRTLTLSGTIDNATGSNGGFLSGNTSSTVAVVGSGAYGEINFQSTGSGNSIGTLTLDRTSSGSLILGNSVTINSAVNLTNGALTIDASLDMVNTTTINRQGGASIGGTIPPTSSGTFNVAYLGSTALVTGLELPTVASGDLNNLTVNSSQTVTLDKIISVGGDLSITSGSTLSSSGSSYNVGLGGNFSNAGTYTPNSNTTTYSGATSQTIGQATYNNLSITAAGLKSLEGNTTVNGTLSLGGGDLDLNARTLTVNNSATSAITRTSGYIRSENTGMSGVVAWVIGTTDGVYTIPFGNSSGAALPLTIDTNGSNDLGTFSAATYPTTSLFPNTPTSGGAADIVSGGADNRNNTVTRFWQLSRSTGSAMDVDVTFSYPSANDPVSAPAQVRMQRWNGTGWDTAIASQTSNVVASPRTILVPGISAFSPWAAADASNPLPVELDYFNANLIEDYVKLDWATLTESKSSHFIIERSPKMDNFKSIGKIASAGTSSERNEYLFNDMTASQQSSNILYYRLKQVDVDGQSKIYPAKAVDIRNIRRESKIKIHPNPAHTDVTVSSFSKEPYNLSIYNQVGEAVYQERVEKETKINVSGFAKGVYIFKCISATGVVNKKVVIE